jgi:hypothetical protein
MHTKLQKDYGWCLNFLFYRGPVMEVSLQPMIILCRKAVGENVYVHCNAF